VAKKLPSVQSGEINFPMNRLIISYDEAVLKPEDIMSKIEKAGYSAAPCMKTEEKPATADERGKNSQTSVLR